MADRVKRLSWVLSLIVGGLYAQSLFFKFSGAEESRYIFQTIADWSGLALFEPAGRLMVGCSELVATALLLIPATRLYGALLSVGVISGAIFFHLVSPLGIVVKDDGGLLFGMAVGIFLLSLWLVWLHRMSLKNFKGWMVMAVCVLISVPSVSRAEDPAALRSKHFNLSRGVALKGYDPVAYVVENRAVKGRESLSARQQGVVYWFSSENNRQLFLNAPERYEPQYGGWCAYAMGKTGEKVDINPETFKVVDGKLYLFYNAFFNNTLKSWNREEMSLRAMADDHWAALDRP